MESEVKPQTKIVDIQPISKGKRILAFLGDFFLVFIMTFVVFNALIMPVSNLMLDSTSRNNTSDNAAKEQFNILYKQKVMHYENDDDIYYYNANVEFTMNCFLSYYSFEDSDVLEAHPQYGHKEENEVIRHFYFDIRNNKEGYLSLLNDFNKENNYFLIEGDSISLINEVKANIKLSFFSPNDMSKDGQTMLANMQNGFMNFYAEVFKDIKANDIVYEGKSYLAYDKIVTDATNFFKWHLVIASLISYLISVVVYFLVIPLIQKDHRTLAMMMMRITRIGTNNLYLLNNIDNLVNTAFMIAFNISIVFFMPMTYVAFTYLFSIPMLPALLFIGLLLDIASMIFILVTYLNQSLCDKLSRSVIIKNDDLDEIYRAKGYDV